MDPLTELRVPPGEGRLRAGERQARAAFRLVSREPTIRGLVSLEALVLTALSIAFLLLRRKTGASERAGDQAFDYFLLWASSSVVVAVFSVAVACATDAKIDGPDGDLRTAFGEVRRRLLALSSWWLISTCGLIALGLAARQVMGPVPAIIVASYVWGVGSFFVVPSIAVLGAGPLNSLAEALRFLRVRWGRVLAGLFLIGFLSGLGFLAFGFLLGLTLHGHSREVDEPLWRVGPPLLLFYLIYALTLATREGFAVILTRDALDDLPGEPPPAKAGRPPMSTKRIVYGALAILVGLWVIAAIAGNHRSSGQPPAPLHVATPSAVKFVVIVSDPDAKHLRPGSPLVLAGAKVGRVAGIAHDQRAPHTYEVFCEVDPGHKDAVIHRRMQVSMRHERARLVAVPLTLERS